MKKATEAKEKMETNENDEHIGVEIEDFLKIANDFVENVEICGAKGMVVIGHGDKDHISDRGISGRTAVTTVLHIWDKYHRFFNDAIQLIMLIEEEAKDKIIH
jgi:hypothetical protein